MNGCVVNPFVYILYLCEYVNVVYDDEMGLYAILLWKSMLGMCSVRTHTYITQLGVNAMYIDVCSVRNNAG